MSRADLPYWLAISRVDNLGAGGLKKLYTYFPDLQTAWEADLVQWKQAGISQQVIAEFIEQKKDLDPASFMAELEKENIQAVTVLDDEYPVLLREIYNAPAILYYKGVLPTENDICLAVVGTRKISSYGRQVASDLVGELADNGLAIVSGLALGIDTLAHQTALNKKVKTFAVLGSGIDRASIYPSINLRLSEQIVEQGGAIISEYPPKTEPLKFNFPARNRIISGLSLGSLIVEADEKSGSLITAQFALEQNREIFAVPGSIYSTTSRGTNKLLKDGAILTTKAQDILEVLNIKQLKTFSANKQILPDNPEEELLLKFLSYEPIHIDFLVKNSCWNTSKVSSTLILMEMKGKVKNLGGMNYVLGR